ncbi:MAG: energy-coupling factor transporter transmembrane protein EcfT [Clostridiales Family XIII bacterium]|jgi:cobalt/nickel transport system permease protein|nr:energy-coupling factor transporter transmembrane protein EcfT [Clostridiales Family XIII bacterium]
MPEWLLTRENYIPETDKDTFINKGILALLRLLAVMRAQDARGYGRFHVDAHFRLACSLLLILFVSLTRQFSFVFIVLTCLLVRLCFTPVRDLKRILALGLTAALFSIVIMIPAALLGSTYSITMIPAKIFVSVTICGIMSCSSRWRDMIAALRSFYIPSIFIFILDITMKYILLLGELTLALMQALRLRSVGKNRRKYTSVSGVAGTLFLKSREMAGSMHSAMICRGFTGEYHRPRHMKFSLADGLYIALHAVFITAFFYIRSAA